MSQSLFYWIIYSYTIELAENERGEDLSQSLFYWIIYSYNADDYNLTDGTWGLNPYFIGLSILIDSHSFRVEKHRQVSILILLDYLFL